MTSRDPAMKNMKYFEINHFLTLYTKKAFYRHEAILISLLVPLQICSVVRE